METPLRFASILVIGWAPCASPQGQRVSAEPDPAAPGRRILRALEETRG